MRELPKKYRYTYFFFPKRIRSEEEKEDFRRQYPEVPKYKIENLCTAHLKQPSIARCEKLSYDIAEMVVFTNGLKLDSLICIGRYYSVYKHDHNEIFNGTVRQMLEFVKAYVEPPLRETVEKKEAEKLFKKFTNIKKGIILG